MCDKLQAKVRAGLISRSRSHGHLETQIGAGMRGSLIWTLFCAGFLAGCAAHLAPLSADGTAVISGRQTENLSAAEAQRTVLIDAARITVDHGMQYFRVVDISAPSAYGSSSQRGSGMRPGADVTIRVYPAGAVSPNAADVWDAQKILTLGVPGEANAGTGIVPASVPELVPSQNAPRSAPRCTAYGCDW